MNDAIFERLSSEMKSALDEKSAQILFAFDTTKDHLHRALRLIEDCGTKVVELRLLPEDQEPKRYARVKLSTADMRGVILTLIENGFGMIRGYNALSSTEESSGEGG